jgi:hypothetical protein
MGLGPSWAAGRGYREPAGKLHEPQRAPAIAHAGYPAARALLSPPFSASMSQGREMSERKSGRSREFDEPIALPDGRKLVTLRDAASYITALPKKEADTREWQTAIEALMLVVEFGGPTMFARIGVMRALNRHHVPEFNPSRKEYHWGRRKLKRDQ